MNAIPPRTRDEIARTLEFLDGSRKIVIGESATRIIEGEPFTHPQALMVLQLVRQRFPQTLIGVTTNGTRLTDELVTALSELAPLEINLSLNSATGRGRRLLMGDQQGGVALNAVKLLEQYGLTWHGSLLALPQVVGWADLTETVRFMSDHGAKTIRIFLPGYTRLAKAREQFAPELVNEIKSWFAQSRQAIKTPLLLEPLALADLRPVVAGVIPGSAAAQAGLAADDVIVRVNGVKPVSRVGAWQQIYDSADCRLDVITDDKERLINFQKKSHTPAGVVMAFDLDPADWQSVEREIARCRARRVVIMTSQLARPVWQVAVQTFALPDCEVEVMAVANRFFGGTIACAGLLVVEDFLTAWREHRQADKPDLICLPGRAFDYRGIDLVGRGHWEIEEATGITTRVL